MIVMNLGVAEKRGIYVSIIIVFNNVLLVRFRMMSNV